MARRHRPPRASAFAPEVEALLAPYRAVLATVRARHGDAYPGSPLIMRELMRPQDRAVFVELHPADGAVLARRFSARRATSRCSISTAGRRCTPSSRRRRSAGSSSIDPPYEEPGELERLAPRDRRSAGEMADRHLCRLVSDQGAARRRRPGRDIAGAAPGQALRLELMVDDPRGAGPAQRLRALRRQPALDACRRGGDDPAGPRRAARPGRLRGFRCETPAARDA